jgi:hypothetical protein
MLKKHPIRQAKERELLGQLWRMRHEQHHVQRIEIHRQRLVWSQALHPLLGMAQALTQPEAIGLL